MNILVVGGNSGIGKEIVSLLEQEDHTVYTLNRGESGDDNGNAHHIKGDVLKVGKDDLEDLPDELHGLVYCPGTINLKPFPRLSEEDFHNDFQINTMGAVRITQLVLSRLKKSENASVVYFSTVAVQSGMTFHASVAAAKGALEGIGRSLAAELAPKVRVNLVAPSLTDTPMASQLLSTDDKREGAKKRHPLQQIGEPKDIANAVSYLLSEKSKWMTGQVLHLDGGLSSLRG
jgi:NAD(P)-dependent dehydrogenase (short-subunit alcohol dehydrogenase family)